MYSTKQDTPIKNASLQNVELLAHQLECKDSRDIGRDNLCHRVIRRWSKELYSVVSGCNGMSLEERSRRLVLRYLLCSLSKAC